MLQLFGSTDNSRIHATKPLGDLFMMPSGEAKKIRARLNGNICLVRGNHDRTAESLKGAFAWIKDYYELTVMETDAPGGRQHIVLCHYAFRVWNQSHHGAWHLYGHSHGTLPEIPGQLSLDVGVDCHEFTPIGYEQVKQAMRKRSKTVPSAFSSELMCYHDGHETACFSS